MVMANPKRREVKKLWETFIEEVVSGGLNIIEMGSPIERVPRVAKKQMQRGS